MSRWYFLVIAAVPLLLSFLRPKPGDGTWFDLVDDT